VGGSSDKSAAERHDIAVAARSLNELGRARINA
jgi:hypothetical protein